MLIGTYKHTVDNKGRLVIPQRYRNDLGDRFVVTRGLDGCLTLYPMEEWSRLSAMIKAAPLAESRTMQRFFFAFAEEAEPDSQGRVVLPQTLRELANIRRDVVVVGVDSHAEVWDSEAWENISKAAGDDDVLEALRKSGL